MDVLYIIICPLFINKRTPFCFPCRIFSFLMLLLWNCVHRRVVAEIRHVWLRHEIYQHKGIWKVSGKLTPEENFSLFRVGLWVNVMVSFRVGGQPNSWPQEKCPLVRVRVCVRISFGIGGNFPRGQFSLSQYVDTMVFKVLCGDLSFKLHRWRKKPVFSFPKEEHVRKI